jgi:glutamine amidotransferase PdxT
MSVYLSVQHFRVCRMEVRKPEQLISVNSLIIPGSESTTICIRRCFATQDTCTLYIPVHRHNE